MVSNNRSAPSLDERLDYIVSSTGDVETSKGDDSLKQDIAFKMLNGATYNGTDYDPVTSFVGQPPSGNLNSKIKSRVKKLALADPEVEQVVDDTLRVNFNEKRNEIKITMDVLTRTGSVQIIEVVS